MVWFVVILFLIILLLLLSQKVRQKLKQTLGICSFALEQSVHKQRNKQKIMDLFQKEKELSNEQIRNALKVSYRSVIRYMDDLEKEGKVRQMGNTGRGVVYVLSTS